MNQAEIKKISQVVRSQRPPEYNEENLSEDVHLPTFCEPEHEKPRAFEVILSGQKEKKAKKDHIKENKLKTIGMKTVMKMINVSNPPLSSMNIPHLSNTTGFTRGELHTLYTMYKALSHATSQRYGVLKYDPLDGMDNKVFRNGVYQVFIQSDMIAQRIFKEIDYNYSNFMNWPEFISGMQMIKAKTLDDKIGLFIKLADTDGNRMLSSKEIETLCSAILSRYVKPADDEFFKSLIQYFKKLIFQSLNYKENVEIPLDAIKDYILSGKEDSHLLSMFCGADF